MTKFMVGESLCAILTLSLAVGPVAAQSVKKPAPTRTAAPVQTKSSKETKEAAAAREEAAEARKMITLTAVNQLDLIVEDVRQIENLTIALSIAKPLIAKLAPHRPDRCRELLTALYDRAEKQVEGSLDQLEDDAVKYGHHIHLRGIINIATSFDPALAEKFIDRLEESKAFSKVLNRSEGTFSAARELIGTNPQRAVAMANQATGEQFTVWTLEFLGQLRISNPEMAGAYALSLLQNLETRKYPTVKELFLLSSYFLVSRSIPFYNAATGRIGQVYNSDFSKIAENLKVDPELARRYLQLCVSLMMQPERYLEIYGPLRASEYDDLTFINAVLLPATQQYLPAAVESLIERRTVLMASLAPGARGLAENAVSAYTTRRTTPIPTPEELIQRAEEGQTLPTGQRSKLYFDAARAAVSKKDYPRAMELVGKVEDARLREKAREFISFEIAQAELRAGKHDEARNWVREDSDRVRKGYLLTLVAASLIEKGPREAQKVNELLSEVNGLAIPLPSGTEKFAMLAGIAAVYAQFDSTQALEYLRRCAETANNAEKLDANLLVGRTFQIEQANYALRLYGSPLALGDAIAKLGRDHFPPLLTIAQTFSNPIVRARAVLSTCSGVI